MKTKAIIYSRISSNNQNHDRQINELKELEEYRVVRIFKESISAFTKSVEERVELNNAINYCIKNEIGVILIHELSRLGRKSDEILNLIKKLKENNVEVYVKSLNLLISNNNTLVEDMVIRTLLDVANAESELLSFRIKSGLEERKKKGFAIGRQYGSVESEEKFQEKHKNVIKYLKRGESIRWTATKLKMSPTTVHKVKKRYNIN